MSFMENYAYYSYLTASVANLFLLFFSLRNFKKNPVSLPLLMAVGLSLLWSGYIAYAIYHDNLLTSATLPLETLRDSAWFLLLRSLIIKQQDKLLLTISSYSMLSKALALIIGIVFILEIFSDLRYQLQQLMGQDIRILAHVIFSIIGLILVEQLYRNAPLDLHWTIKFLSLGLGALFGVDFIVYSKSLLFTQIDFMLWNSRGFLNALIVPLLVISIRRLQTNSGSNIKSARKTIFHTAVLFVTGAYLILMSFAGFYIRDYDGNWGEVAQIIFIFFALIMLLLLLGSGKVRSMTKVYFNQHFFNYRYDYRDIWIDLSKTIAQLDSVNKLSGVIINTLMKLTDTSGGALWLTNDQGDFYLAEEISLTLQSPQLIKANNSLIQFMSNKQWVIDFIEFSNTPEVYDDVDLSVWLAKDQRISLIVPLFRQHKLVAFVVLAKAKINRQLIWEDHDLLKTVGMQLTNALALSHTSEALFRSRQFEAYNQLSAFLVHDLKNLVAQIALIVKNSEKHRYKPEFIDDSIETLENVVNKIDGILGQLKKGWVKTDIITLLNIGDVIEDVILQQKGHKPILNTEMTLDKCEVLGEKDKLTAILGHLVQNAQEATEDHGVVQIVLSKDEHYAIIKIIDNGVGMDAKFVAERLFKPFDTTKGNAGMGIGVYEARDTILKYDGVCDVESTLGVGTTFTIKLPLAK
jgi:putative PEP-CTERM system histidine kinase